jgi:Flp pilus assembly protein TadG
MRVTTVRQTAARRHRAPRGQSLVELAIILPFLLGFVGGATDLARAYFASITLESAVRNAAEEVASYSTDATDALADAVSIVCLESSGMPGFTPGGGLNPEENCSAPAVSVPAFSVSTTSLGASAAEPIGTAHVHASIVFDTLLPYPFIPEGGWTLNADTTYSVSRNR